MHICLTVNFVLIGKKSAFFGTKFEQNLKAVNKSWKCTKQSKSVTHALFYGKPSTNHTTLSHLPTKAVLNGITSW